MIISLPRWPVATSLSGNALRGDRLVRLTYLDEGGISWKEPYVVVAGVIVHGDRQLSAVEEHLGVLLEKYIPESDWPGFVFHAKDIWSGAKYFRDRDRWPLAKGWTSSETYQTYQIYLGCL